MTSFEPFDPALWNDPYPALHALREQKTVHWAPEAGAFCVTRFDTAEAVFRQPEVFSSRSAFNLLLEGRWNGIGTRDVFEMLRFLARARFNPLALRVAPESIISSDPPNHGPLRHAVNRGFTPRRIAAWEPRVRALCESYVHGLGEGDGFDVVEQIAHPLPMTVIAEMLGVDPDRIEDFRRWSNGIIETVTGSARADTPAAFLANAGELLAYLRGVIERRREAPGDDLISILVDPRRGEVLDTMSVMIFATILLVAGNETTTNAIGNTVDVLLRRPDVLAEVSEDPGLIPNLIEESIRLESPFRLMPRRALQDTTLQGTHIPKDSTLLIMIGAANRDERRFENADRFDLHRDTRGHLGFGHGIHFCLGASLARLEARVAIETLVPLLHQRELRDGGGARADSYFTRGFTRLELTGQAVTVAA